jgi:hypothetical protein
MGISPDKRKVPTAIVLLTIPTKQKTAEASHRPAASQLAKHLSDSALATMAQDYAQHKRQDATTRNAEGRDIMKTLSCIRPIN